MEHNDDQESILRVGRLASHHDAHVLTPAATGFEIILKQWTRVL